MKNLIAAVSYSFNNFYDSLNRQGQIIFSVIVLLIIILCVLLLVAYIIEGAKARLRFNHLKQEQNSKSKEKANVLTSNTVPIKEQTNVLTSSTTPIKEETNTIIAEEKPMVSEDTAIEDIAQSIEKALQEDSPITLTNFEEDQEKTAIISIDELLNKAKELDIADDEEYTGVNYLEKYNLEPSEVENMVMQTQNGNNSSEVKAFKVSQVISPIYGVKKEVINKGN